jgi:hypothetical protein
VAALTRENFRRLDTPQLQRRYRDLTWDTSAQTADEECGRMFALQEIGAVLEERGVPSDEWEAKPAKLYADQFGEDF